ncbi:MAG: hypothetical protein HGB12_17665, partial [Bacteroidetes bacterium]|nr:hypothetical protein [Bacteroidota bacterium]
MNCIFIANEFYWFSIIPAFLLLLLLFIFSLDILLLLIVFLTPLSVNLNDLNLNIGLNLPTEPILFGVMILFIVRVVYEGGFDRNILRHPVSKAILFYLFWIFVTSFTSSLPLVSFKFFVSKLWFILPIYFLGTQLFKNPKNIRRFIWMYLISFLIVIFYTIFAHSKYGFDEQTSHWVMSPFYNDHTSYGALL